MRLDQRLVDLGVAPSRAKAQAMIAAGEIMVDGATARKPAQAVVASARIERRAGGVDWVSRGALKLLAGLDLVGRAPTDAVVLDLGASTGGFTEVCLARGARRVVAVDVGRGQLHPSLAGDPRVTAIEGLNARDLTAAYLPEPPDWIVADLSFISLSKALPTPLSLAAPRATLVALVKPQFEVGPARVGKGGLVADPAARAEALRGVERFVESAGWRTLGVCDSPIRGGDGNVEFLLAADRGWA